VTVDADASAPERSTRSFWVGFALGVPIIALGIRGLLANSVDTRPAELARWLVGSAVVHDAVVLPLVAVIGLGGRRLSGWAWPALRWALATTAILLVVSRPFVNRSGYNPRNPTALPRNYGVGVSVAIGVVWLLALGGAIVLRRRQARTRA
jgi:hypothetical protein